MLRPLPLCAVALAAALASSASPVRADVRWGPWSALLPLDQSESRGGLGQTHRPERELARFELNGPGPDAEREHPGKAGPARWRPLERAAGADQALVDLTAGLPADQVRHAVAYLHRAIEADEPRELRVLAGSDDGLRMWLNGEVVVSEDVPRGFRRGQHRVLLRLRPGTNHLFVKVANVGGAWSFQLVHDAGRIAEIERETRLEVNAAIDRGVEALLGWQELDGSWRHEIVDYPSGQTALSLYTLLECGVSPRHHAVRRALAFLRGREPRRTYSLACQLMAFAELKEPELRGDVERLTHLMLDWRRKGYAYPDGALDLSNTQYGALGLRAAAKAGVDVPDKAWSGLALHVLGEYATEDGGFSYRRRERPTASMTAAGVTVLAVCREMLGGGGLTPREEAELDEKLEAALAWLARHYSAARNAIPAAPADGAAERWFYYYLYGLERVGAFTGRDELGDHDWYWDGAAELLRRQAPEGHWASAYDERQANTCFALLFLRRATASVSGVGAQPRIAAYGDDDPRRAVSLRASGDTPLLVWVSSFGDETLASFARDGDERRFVRVLSVEYLSGDELLAEVTATPGDPAHGERYAARVRFARGGEHPLRARVRVADPDTGEAVVLESQTLSVRIQETLDEWMIEYASDATRNLLRGAKLDAEASSQRDDGRRAAFAADDRLATCWLSADRDEVHELALDLARPIRADTIVLTPARPDSLAPDHAARPTRVHVWVNRRAKPIEVTLDPGHPGKTPVELGRAETIRLLRLAIVETVPGTVLKHASGFAEVELQARR